jgi:hypothetical protein
LLRVYKYTCTFNFEVVLAVQPRFSLGNAGCTRFQTNAYRHSDCVYFLKTGFQKIIFQTFCVYFPLEKLVNGKHFPVSEKHFPVKEKFGLVFRKVFSFYFGRKTLSGSCEKFRNVMLFVDYIKFDPQTFGCYIYFVLNICFSISSLRI